MEAVTVSGSSSEGYGEAMASAFGSALGSASGHEAAEYNVREVGRSFEGGVYRVTVQVEFVSKDDARQRKLEEKEEQDRELEHTHLERELRLRSMEKAEAEEVEHLYQAGTFEREDADHAMDYLEMAFHLAEHPPGPAPEEIRMEIRESEELTWEVPPAPEGTPTIYEVLGIKPKRPGLMEYDLAA